MSRITADATTLLRQASMTADEYLREAVTSIDRHLGEGYAAKHPALIAAMIQTAASDYNNALLCQHIGDVADAIAAVADEMHDQQK
jgi:hypothetical protein